MGLSPHQETANFGLPRLLLRPIVPVRFPWEVWQSQSLRQRSTKRIMNAADQFETIVSQHYEPLFRFALSLTRAESDAWDLTQQTFYVWATKGHQLRDRSKVKTWLFTTLHHAFLARWRRQCRYIHHHWENIADELPAVSPLQFDQVDSAQVLSALAQVDEVYQAAVALFYLEDCPYQDIAAILGIPIGTVKSRIARGIAQLREILLSGDVRVSSPQPEVSGRRARLAALMPERGSEEWDLSSAYLREQFGAAGITNCPRLH